MFLENSVFAWGIGYAKSRKEVCAGANQHLLCGRRSGQRSALIYICITGKRFTLNKNLESQFRARGS